MWTAEPRPSWQGRLSIVDSAGRGLENDGRRTLQQTLEGYPQGLPEKSHQHMSFDPRLLLRSKGRIESSLFSARLPYIYVNKQLEGIMRKRKSILTMIHSYNIIYLLLVQSGEQKMRATLNRWEPFRGAA